MQQSSPPTRPNTAELVAEDEEQALRQLVASVEVFKASIETHGGRIFNTAGDAVLAEFQSAVEAVRSAIDIQERLSVRNEAYAPNRRMMFRMGISIGDVVENGGDLLGDGVNIAARLQTLSQPGGLAISRWVQEQVAGKVAREFRDTGHQIVKNMPAPIHVFQSGPAAAAPAAAAQAEPAAAAPAEPAAEPKVRRAAPIHVFQSSPAPTAVRPAIPAEPKVRRPVFSPAMMDRIRGIVALAIGVAFLGGVIGMFALNRPAPAPVALREAPPASAKLENPAPLQNPAPLPVAVERLPDPPAPTSPQTPAFMSPEQSLATKGEQAPSAPAESALPPSAALPDLAPPAKEEPHQELAPSPPTQAAAPPPAADNGNAGLAQDQRPPESSAPSAPVLTQDTAPDRKQQKKRQCAEVLERAQLGDLTSDDRAFLRSNCH